MLFLTGVYGLWNLMAGRNGFYLPYILRTVGDQSQAMSVGLGFVPAITAAGFHTLAWILTGFVTASALLGLLLAPSNAGKSLDQIQREQTGRFTRAPSHPPSPQSPRARA